jgi:hypothetical protein
MVVARGRPLAQAEEAGKRLIAVMQLVGIADPRPRSRSLAWSGSEQRR